MSEKNEALLKNYDAEIAEKNSEIRRESEKNLLDEFPIYNQQVRLIKSVFSEDTKGALDQTQRLLVNLGIAIYSGKESAIDWSITRALNHGASAEMIKDVIEVAALNSGSLGMSSIRIAHNILNLRKIKRPKS